MSFIADIFAALNNFESKQPDDYYIEKKRTLAAFLAQELTPPAEANTGTVVAYIEKRLDWLGTQELGPASAAMLLAAEIRAGKHLEKETP